MSYVLVEGDLGKVQALGNLINPKLLLAVEGSGDDGRAFGFF